MKRIIQNICVNCGEEIMIDDNELDFCDVECYNEFSEMMAQMKSESN